MTPDNQSLPPLPDLNWMQSYSKQQTQELMREYGDACFSWAISLSVGIIQENAMGCSRVTESILLSQADAIKELLE